MTDETRQTPGERLYERTVWGVAFKHIRRSESPDGPYLEEAIEDMFVEFGIDPDLLVETLRRRLLWGERAERRGGDVSA